MSDEMGGPVAAVAMHAGKEVHGNREPDHVTTLSGDEATQGIKLGHMRYVLGIGLALAVIAGLIIAIIFAH